MNRFLLNRIFWLQALTLVLMLLPLCGAGYFVWSKHQNVQSHLAAVEPRYARLLGMMANKSELQAAGQQASEQLARWVYPASQDATQAGNDAQQRVRTLFADSKLDIISIQVLPVKGDAKDGDKFDRIGIDLRVEGDLTGIQNALALLAAQTPMVIAESVSLQTIGALKPASTQRLAGQFNFTVLRVRS